MDTSNVYAAGADLRHIILALNRAAYLLAQQFALRTALPAHIMAQARTLDLRLTEVAPHFARLLPADQSDLGEVWTEARLDLDYILSDGSQPTSIRLYRFLKELDVQTATSQEGCTEP